MRIVTLTDHVDCPSGFGGQHRIMAKALASKWPGLVAAGFHDDGAVRFLPSGRGICLPLRDTPTPTGGRAMAPGWWAELKAQTQPDVLITLGDWHMFDAISADVNRPRPWVHWIPVDSARYPMSRNEQIASVDMLVFMSEFGKTVYQKHTVGRVRSSLIPHGIDTTVFKPADENQKQAARRLWGYNLSHMNGRTCDLTDKVVLVCHDTHQWRKQTWRLVEMMTHLPENYVLCLHCTPGPRPGSDGWHLADDVKALGLESRVFFTGRKVKQASGKSLYMRPAVEAPYLAMFIQMADLRVCATGGEGFGICTIEAMACGVPSVITDCTTSAELVGSLGQERAGALVEPAARWRKGGCETEHSLVRPVDLAAAVLRVITDDEERATMAAEGVRRVAELYTEQRVGGMWIKLIEWLTKGS